MRREQEVVSHTLFFSCCVWIVSKDQGGKASRLSKQMYSCPYCKVKWQDLEQWTKIIFQNVNHRENLEVGNKEYQVSILAVGD